MNFLEIEIYDKHGGFALLEIHESELKAIKDFKKSGVIKSFVISRKFKTREFPRSI